MPSYRCMLIYSSPSVCPPALCLTVVCFLVLSGPTGKRVFLLPPPLSLSLSVLFSLSLSVFLPLSLCLRHSLSLSFSWGVSLGGGGGCKRQSRAAKGIAHPRSYLHHLTMLRFNMGYSDNDERIWCSCKVSDRMCRGSCRAQNNKNKCASHAIIFKVLSAYQLLHVHFLAKTPSQNGEGKHRILGLYRDYTT